MASPKTGVLVILQEERILEELAKLLESYRIALRNSKVRKGDEPDPKEVVTRYYRMEKEIATDLEKLLPEVVEPASWKSAARPDATGTIRSAASKSELMSPVIANSVLIVRQTREIHSRIAEVIQKIQFGDAVLHPGMRGMGGGMGGTGGGMGGGMGGGSFGGGFFSVDPKSSDRK